MKEEIEAAPLVAGMAVKIVAIDGHGGAGKSTLAKKLAKELSAEIIQTDDFASWDNPQDWWPRLVRDVLDPIKNGAKTVTYGRSSWGVDHKPQPIKGQPVTRTVILEGVGAARKEFRPYISYAIWVEAPKEVCIARGLERDGQEARVKWEKWRAQEEEYIQQHSPHEYANKVVSGV